MATICFHSAEHSSKFRIFNSELKCSVGLSSNSRGLSSAQRLPLLRTLSTALRLKWLCGAQKRLANWRTPSRSNRSLNRESNLHTPSQPLKLRDANSVTNTLPGQSLVLIQFLRDFEVLRNLAQPAFFSSFHRASLFRKVLAVTPSSAAASVLFPRQRSMRDRITNRSMSSSGIF